MEGQLWRIDNISYKPGAKKVILKFSNSLSNNRTELAQSPKEDLKVVFTGLYLSEQKMQKTKRKEQYVYLQTYTFKRTCCILKGRKGHSLA